MAGTTGLEAPGLLRDRQADTHQVTRHSQAKAPCCNHLDFPARSLAGKTRTTRLSKIM